MVTIGIIGVVASLIMEGIKKYFGTSGFESKVAVVVVSLIGGAVYYFLKDTGMWTSFMGILATASTFYAFFLKK